MNRASLRPLRVRSGSSVTVATVVQDMAVAGRTAPDSDTRTRSGITANRGSCGDGAPGPPAAPSLEPASAPTMVVMRWIRTAGGQPDASDALDSDVAPGPRLGARCPGLGRPLPLAVTRPPVPAFGSGYRSLSSADSSRRPLRPSPRATPRCGCRCGRRRRKAIPPLSRRRRARRDADTARVAQQPRRLGRRPSAGVRQVCTSACHPSPRLRLRRRSRMRPLWRVTLAIAFFDFFSITFSR